MVGEKKRMNAKQNKMFHENTYGLKDPSVIYAAYSSVGSLMKVSEVPQQDLNNYIHTKNPKTVKLQEGPRDQNYGFQQPGTIQFLGRTSVETFKDDPAMRPRYKLKLDDSDGSAGEVRIHTFDYDKKLRHFIKKPQKKEDNIKIEE